MAVKDDFEALIQELIKADEAGGDCHFLEPPLTKMLDLVRSNPADRPFFVSQFVRIATEDASIPLPPELVPFCMRELRFPEVLQAVRATYDKLEADNKHARYMSYCSHVVKAYDDFVWEDAGMWDYYRAKELVPSIVPALARRLTSDSADVVFNALFALEEIGPPAKNALPAIEQFVRHWRGHASFAARARLAIEAIAGRKPE